MTTNFNFRIIIFVFLSLFGIKDSFSFLIKKNSEEALLRSCIDLKISNPEPGKDTLKSKIEKWTAAELWAQSVSRNLKLEGNVIVPEDNLLIENDAAALGSIRSEAWDTLSKGFVIRKYLELPVLPSGNVWISMLIYPLVPAEPMSGGKLEFKVNGNKPIVYELRHFWTSVPVYYAWTDQQTPETPEHRYFVRRNSDMYGTLFTVDFSAELSGENTLKINMATDSPGFKYYELIANGQRILIPGSNYQWKLAPGLNKLGMRSIDTLGNPGVLSSLEINYTLVPK